MTRPISLDLLADHVRPFRPRVSPDGRSVAFVVSPMSKKKHRADATIWMLREGGEAFPFTSGEKGATAAEWSPDGTRLVFTSERDETEADKGAALWLIPAGGGEGQRLGTVRGELGEPQWSPDGTRIAFTLRDPDTTDEKQRKKDERDHEVVEEDMHQDRLCVIDIATGRHRVLTTGAFSVTSWCWAPDGEALVAVTTPLPTFNARFLPTRVVRVPAHGGLPVTLATFRMTPHSPVVREVDGRRVVAVVGNDHRADPSPSVWTVPWDGGAPSLALPDLRGSVDVILPDPDRPDHVIALITRGTRVHPERVSLATGERTPLLPSPMRERGAVVDLAVAGGTLAMVWTASDVAREVWTHDLPSGKSSQRTALSADFDGLLAPGEVVRWRSFDGVEIEGLLVRPAGTEAPLPLFVQIHGGPASQWDDAAQASWHDWAQMLASRGWAVLMPNPRGSVGYGSAFEKLLQDDVGGGESKDLVAGAQAMVERGIADPDRLAIGGWSWGGYLTARTITQTGMFRAAVMGAGVANLASDHGAGDIPEYNTLLYPNHPYDPATWEIYARGTPIREARSVTTPTLILHGGSDDRVHPTQGQEFYRALQVCGVPTRFVRYPREGHSIKERAHQIDLMERILAWLDQWVPTT